MRKRTSAQHIAGIAMLVMAWVACNKSSGAPASVGRAAYCDTCSGDNDCSLPLTCVLGECTAPCRSDSDCPKGYCYLSQAEKQVCGCFGNGHICDPCTNGTHCIDGLTCTQTSAFSKVFYCQPTANCATSADCGGLPCDAASRQCVCIPPDAGPDANGPDEGIVTSDGGDSGQDAGTVTTTQPGPTGDVSTIVYPEPGGGYGWNLGGQFTTLTSGGYTLTLTKFGPCTFTSFSGTAAVTSNVSAGTLTSMHGTTTDTATPDAMDNYYAGGSGATPHFNPGDMVTLAWTGTDAAVGVGPGSATLVAPGSVTVTQPLATDGGPITIDRTVPFPFAFTGMSAGIIDVGIYGGDGLSSLDCTYDATMPGSFMISAAAMSGLGPGSGAFFVSLSSTKVLTVGTMPVTAAVRGNAIGSDGMPFATTTATIK